MSTARSTDMSKGRRGWIRDLIGMRGRSSEEGFRDGGRGSSIRVEERKARKGRRHPSSHAGWEPASIVPTRCLLRSRTLTREPDLVPVRHGRMLVSPFTFYRGAAKIMAADLKDTPRAGLTVQLCGDAHLSNFGVFASPERALLFDLNDFDETLPGPFEYDVKRMSASFTIAARNNGFTKADSTRCHARVRAGLPRSDGRVRQMRTMDIWYAHLSEEELMSAIDYRSASRRRTRARRRRRRSARRRPRRAPQKARTRDSLQALSKLAEHVDGNYRIVSPAADRDPVTRALRVLRHVGR